MKKILCFIAAAVLVSLVGCEDKSQDKSQKAETSLPSRTGKNYGYGRDKNNRCV